MKTNFLKINQLRLSFLLFLILSIILGTCKNEYVDESSISKKEKKILDKSSDIFPDVIVQSLNHELEALRQQPYHDAYLDSINLALDNLRSTIRIIPNLDFVNYKNILDSTYVKFINLKSTSSDNCLGIAFSKSALIDVGASGTLGAGIVYSLSAKGGGGVNYIYDFVNMDRQIYYLTMCSTGSSFGSGLGAAMGANIGYTGIYELITGVDYLNGASGLNKFNGKSKGKDFNISAGIIILLGLDLNIGIGKNQEAIGDFNLLNNLLPCPGNFILIENGTKGFYFQMGGSLSANVGGEISVAFTYAESGSEIIGIPESYHSFGNYRILAGINMAEELLNGEPLNGILASKAPVDIVASALAIIYSNKDFSICPAKLPSIGTLPISYINYNSAISGGIIIRSNGASITSKGVCWSTIQNPTTNDNKTNNGTSLGEYVSIIPNLSPNTRYYLRAYATNSAGTSYGSQLSFKTNESPPVPPTVLTTESSNVTTISATSGGNVTSSGGANVTARGICYSKNLNPTIDDYNVLSGSGTGNFVTELSDLTPDSKYYARAYAINSVGTGYGNEITFTTLQQPVIPTVTTSDVTSIQPTSATGGGNVTNSGGANVTERGICYSKNSNPTVTNNKVQSGIGTGIFVSEMNDL